MRDLGAIMGFLCIFVAPSVLVLAFGYVIYQLFTPHLPIATSSIAPFESFCHGITDGKNADTQRLILSPMPGGKMIVRCLKAHPQFVGRQEIQPTWDLQRAEIVEGVK